MFEIHGLFNGKQLQMQSNRQWHHAAPAQFNMMDALQIVAQQLLDPRIENIEMVSA